MCLCSCFSFIGTAFRSVGFAHSAWLKNGNEWAWQRRNNRGKNDNHTSAHIYEAQTYNILLNRSFCLVLRFSQSICNFLGFSCSPSGVWSIVKWWHSYMIAHLLTGWLTENEIKIESDDQLIVHRPNVENSCIVFRDSTVIGLLPLSCCSDKSQPIFISNLLCASWWCVLFSP